MNDPWNYDPKSPFDAPEPKAPRSEEQDPILRDSDIPEWPSRNYDGSPEKQNGCMMSVAGILALPLGAILAAVVAFWN